MTMKTELWIWIHDFCQFFAYLDFLRVVVEWSSLVNQLFLTFPSQHLGIIHNNNNIIIFPCTTNFCKIY